MFPLQSPRQTQKDFLATRVLFVLGLLFLIVLIPNLASTQSPQSRGVLRLRVRVKQGETTKNFGRKRFFLFKGGLEQNKKAIEVDQQQFVSRDCYYQRAGASQPFRRWLDENDCETVYCREIQPQDVEGPTAVPEFVSAVAAGMKQFGTAEVARKWLTVNLPDQLRIGFYNLRQTALQSAIKNAETSSGGPVLSVMTDRNGTAYFTDLEPGLYTLSNLIPAELGNTSVSWNCEVQVKQGDLAHEKAYLISNNPKERNVKCVAVEKPLPACPVAN